MAIVGRSGNGKSTLLSLLAGLGVPDEGDILFNGESTKKRDLELYRREKFLWFTRILDCFHY